MTTSESTVVELREGDPAPGFTTVTDEGSELSLSDLRGKKVVLYFYPKDDTPGCTIESCEFRDAHPRFIGKDAVILGVSPDSVRSHQKFKAKFDLPFTLLADEGHAIADRYGTWGKKTLFGVSYTGTLRTTFIIDRDGRIAKIFHKVKSKGHADEVEQALASIP